METTTSEIKTATIQNGTRTIAYREAGAGPAVLLVHGWPTSSYLWRDIMPAIARTNRVIAIDLPGLGHSDKPLDVTYGFPFFSGVIDDFLDAVGVDRVALAGHDIGGPIALHWAMHHRDRTSGLALLNTLLYPDLHPAVVEFVRRLLTPGPREQLTSPEGLTELFREGLANPDRATPTVLAAIVEPFPDEDSRLALAKAGTELSLRTFGELGAALPTFDRPLRVVYGVRDAILPDVARTMARVQEALPGTTVTQIAEAGHFLQEDAPTEVAAALASFFSTIE